MSKLALAIDKFKNGYPCTSCGICCTKVSTAVSNIDNLAKAYNIPIEDLQFPYSWDESGKCNMLIDNKCSVYYNRPLMCSIDKFIEVANLDKEEFYKENIKVCNSLMDENRIDKSFRI